MLLELDFSPMRLGRSFLAGRLLGSSNEFQRFREVQMLNVSPEIQTSNSHALFPPGTDYFSCVVPAVVCFGTEEWSIVSHSERSKLL